VALAVDADKWQARRRCSLSVAIPYKGICEYDGGEERKDAESGALCDVSAAMNVNVDTLKAYLPERSTMTGDDLKQARAALTLSRRALAALCELHPATTRYKLQSGIKSAAGCFVWCGQIFRHDVCVSQGIGKYG
jgi:hypothetical protein